MELGSTCHTRCRCFAPGRPVHSRSAGYAFLAVALHTSGQTSPLLLLLQHGGPTLANGSLKSLRSCAFAPLLAPSYVRSSEIGAGWWPSCACGSFIICFLGCLAPF